MGQAICAGIILCLLWWPGISIIFRVPLIICCFVIMQKVKLEDGRWDRKF
jgi:hypothetical protein